MKVFLLVFGVLFFWGCSNKELLYDYPNLTKEQTDLLKHVRDLVGNNSIEEKLEMKAMEKEIEEKEKSTLKDNLKIEIQKLREKYKKDDAKFQYHRDYLIEDTKTRKRSLKFQKIAQIYIDQGKYKKAYKALEKQNVILYGNTQVNGQFYHKISLLYFKLKKYYQAYEYQKKSATIFSRIRENSFLTLNFLNQKEYNVQYLFPIAFAYQSKTKSHQKNVIKETFDLWLKFKGQISSAESQLMRLKHFSKDKKIDELLTVYKDYAYLFVKKLFYQEDFLVEDKEKLEKIEQKKNNLERYLRPKLRQYAQSDYITSDNIAEELEKDELYIDFVKTANNYYFFTIDNRNHIAFHMLDKNVQEVDRLITELRENITNKKHKNIESFKKLSSTLYQILFKDIMTQHKKLIISPDGLLNLVPFEALYTNNKKYLIQEKDIFYVSSGKDLYNMRTNLRIDLSNREIVLFSYLNYDYDSKTSITRNDTAIKINRRSLNHHLIASSGVQKLSATKDEALHMKKLFNKSRFFTYTDLNGTKEVLYKLKSPQILHFSTHSTYAKDDADVGQPLLRAGLTLSEYDAVFDGDNRGLMTALEFSTLNLFNTELVFFASCESGLGDMHSALGVSGLNRGARIAGAQRVISTLWEISDKKSVELTQSFYEHLVKHKSGALKRIILSPLYREDYAYAKALKDAKLKMINLHPYYWAGFVEYGLD